MKWTKCIFIDTAILGIVSMATTLDTEQTQIQKDGLPRMGSICVQYGCCSLCGHSSNHRRARQTEQNQKSNQKIK